MASLVYDLPTESLQPIPQRHFNAPQMRNHGVELLNQNAQVNDLIGKAILSIQGTIDDAAALEADNATAEFIRKTLYDPEKGYMTTAGKTATDSLEPVRSSFEKEKKRISHTFLKNKRQRDLYEKHAMKRFMTADIEVTKHAMKEAQTYELKELMVSAELSGLDAIEHRENPKKFAIHLGEAMKKAEKIADKSGYAEDSAQREKLYLEASSSIHYGAISEFLKDKKIENAKEHYEKFKDDITLADREKIEKALEEKRIGVAAEEAATRVWNEGLPKHSDGSLDYNREINIYAMKEKIREDYAKDPEVKKEALQILDDRFATFQRTEKDANDANGNVVWGLLLNGKSWNDIRGTQAWRDLSDKEKQAIKSQWENYKWAQESRYYTRLERDAYLLTDKGADRYNYYMSDPTSLKKLGDKAFWAMERHMSPAMFNDLKELRANANTQTKPAPKFILGQNEVKALLLKTGMVSTDGKGNIKSKELALATTAIKEAIEKQQKITGRTMDYNQALAFGAKVLAQNVLIPGGGFIYGDRTMPAWKFTDKDLSNIKIPQKERKELVEDMAAAYERTGNPRYEPTEDNLRRFYMEYYNATNNPK